jgi:small subunit ribosomal protein S8e
MPQSHGSQYKRKRAYEAGSEPTETVLGPAKKRWVGTRGGGWKIRLASADSAVVTDKSTGKSAKTKLLRVIRNPANVDYQRRGVITKGAIIDTDLGQARVTSRPGQDGVINAILVEKSQKN